MARGFETGSDNERIDELQKQLDDVLDSQISSVGGNEDISIDSSRGARNAASGDSGGVRSNEPIIHQITDVDEGGTPTGVFDKINIISSMAIIDHTSTPITLRFIQGTVKDGARIKITPKIGKTIDIEPGGNILTSSTITITDIDYFELVKYSEAETGVTGGAFKILLNGSSGGGTILPVVDTTSIVKGSVDPTKEMRFEVDGFDPGVVRVMTLPNADVTLAGLEVTSQIWTGSNLLLNATFRDGLFFIQDTDDITRQLQFNLGIITPGQTRILTVPDASVTLAGLEVVSQTFTGENIFLNAKVRTDTFKIQNTADITKELDFALAGATTGKTITLVSNHSDDRILTLPDTTTDLAGLGVLSQTWTGTNIFVGNTVIRDTNFFIQDGADITKQLNFALEGGTTGFVLTLASVITGNRTLTFPDTTTMLAGLGTLSQTWTGTNIFAGNTTVRDTNFFIQQTSDITKQLKFDIVGASTGQVLTLESNHTDNRTLTFPDTTTDLAGLGVISQTWTGTNEFVGITTVIDSNFGIKDFSDNTKVINFDASLITTATTRIYSLPDSTTTLAGLGVLSQTWTGTNIFAGITNIRTDNNFVMQDPTDPTKQVIWDLSGISASTIRTITMPDNDVTLGAGGDSQTPWLSTIDADGNDLENLGLTVYLTSTLGASTEPFSVYDGTNLRWHVPTSDGFVWTIGAFDQILGLGGSVVNVFKVLNMQNANKIINVNDPTADQDVVTRKFLEDNPSIPSGVQDSRIWTNHETTEFDFEVWLTNNKNGDIGSSVPLAEDTAFYIPIWVGDNVTLREIGIDVTSAGAATVTLAIYDSEDGQNYPRTRIDFDTSTNNLSLGTGIRTLTFFEALAPGLYWLLVRTDNGFSIRQWGPDFAVSVGHFPASGVTGAMAPISGYFDDLTSSTPDATADNDMSVLNGNSQVGIPAIYARFT